MSEPSPATEPKTHPTLWSTILIGAIGLAGGFALLYLTFLEQHGTLPRVCGSLVGGAMLGGAAAGARFSPRFRPAVAFVLGISTAFVGGPVAVATTLFVKGLEEGAGFRAFGAVIAAILGMMCGWFITIPVGLALGIVLAILVAIVDLLPRARA